MFELLGFSRELLDRYDRPAPRYTSYPPIPNWSEPVRRGRVPCGAGGSRGAADDPVSIYVHLPFCVSRCWYCGCNATVTPARGGAASGTWTGWIREAGMVRRCARRAAAARPRCTGAAGRRTTSPAGEIERLAEELHAALRPGFRREHGDRGRPAGLRSVEQLGLLRALGFNRLSIGVQDFDPVVQRAIGRVQPQAMVLDAARRRPRRSASAA